ncbi:MAG: hypothetical protein ACOY3N_17390 [Bradyrhizobium sp.]|uniref:hypothetical protein n=1 Tax=Bradyrhizobium sp. TaxID=376 RepID=UPI003BF3AE37
MSITATASSPTMKPTLAMSPSFSRLIRAMIPECTKIPGATSLTGNSAAPARAIVAVPSRNKAAIIEAMRDTFLPQFKEPVALRCNKEANAKLSNDGASSVAWITFNDNEEEAR